MPGGTTQLSAIGAQDTHLTQDPKITYFKKTFYRYSNFAVESIEQTFNGSVGFGKKIHTELTNMGDLVSQIFLQVTLPEVRYDGEYDNYNKVQFAWTPSIGHALIEEVSIEIGGAVIDRHYAEWLDIWGQLSNTSDRKNNLDKMIGNIPALTDISCLSWNEPDNNLLKPAATIYVPLQFYFNRENGLALPMIALSRHSVAIKITIAPLEKLCIRSDAFKLRNNSMNITDASLLVSHIFLSDYEREKFVKRPHNYLIDQIQYSGPEPVTGNSCKTRLSLNHPVESIYWVLNNCDYHGGRFMVYNNNDWEKARDQLARRLLMSQFDINDFGFLNNVSMNTDDGLYIGDNHVEYMAIDPSDQSMQNEFIIKDMATNLQLDCARRIGRLPQHVALIKTKTVCDMRNKVQGIMRIYTDDGMLAIEVAEITRNDLTIADLSVPVTKFLDDNRNDYIKNMDLNVYLNFNTGIYIDGTASPVAMSELVLNGQPRESKRDSLWHNYVTAYMHHTGTSHDGVYHIPFGLSSEKFQPSGTCNFSRIDTSSINFTLDRKTVPDDVATIMIIKVFAKNRNMLQIMGGMGAVVYSN